MGAARAASAACTRARDSLLTPSGAIPHVLLQEMLAAEEAMRDMMMDAEGGEAPQEEQLPADATMRQVAGSSGKKVGVGGSARVKGGSKVKVKGGKGGKAAKAAAPAAEGMALG